LSRVAVRIEDVGGAARIQVRAQPRAPRSELAGEHDGALRVRVAAPPVDGAANDELVRFLGKLLGRPASALRVVSGSKGRSKVVEVAGLDAAAVRSLLGLE
jgi:uncharacterized protein